MTVSQILHFACVFPKRIKSSTVQPKGFICLRKVNYTLYLCQILPRYESILNEARIFYPPEAFAKTASVSSFEEYERLYTEAAADPEAFWAKQAEELHWFKKWDTVLEWKEPFAKWFVGGQDQRFVQLPRPASRHAEEQSRVHLGRRTGRERGRSPICSFIRKCRQICECVAQKLGIETGDRVALYMPLVPELAIAMLACARIGATHTVIFGGFSADAIRDRVNDGGCKADRYR